MEEKLFCTRCECLIKDDDYYTVHDTEYFDECYNEHEQMLIDYAKFYGFDEEDIMILLDYGYTADEIESFLSDTNLFYEALQIALAEEDDPDQMGFDLCDICG